MNLLMVGSSIFEQWGRPVIPGYSVVNRAVGGTVTSYWMDHLAGALDETAPDRVLFYCGSNDVCMNVDAGTVIAHTACCRAIVRAFAPACLFGYFSVIKAPQKSGRLDAIEAITHGVRPMLGPADLFIETNEVFLENGRPVMRFFKEDGLHLTCEGYDALAAYALPKIAAWLSRYRPHV